jgi:cellulose synthase/poly-beta-1,6-N-acetylglucosamine synthase-like glycosyltransferase
VTVTGVAWLAYVTDQVLRLCGTQPPLSLLAQTVTYILLVTLLALSASAYLVTRIGYLHRARGHRPASRAELDAFADGPLPGLTILVPSYREETRVIRQTLLSAALQEYRDLRIVLLIDDPPEPTDTAARRALEGSRAMPAEIEKLLEVPRRRFADAHAAFDRDMAGREAADAVMLSTLAGHYTDAATWLDRQRQRLPAIDHADLFLARAVFGRLAGDFRAVAFTLGVEALRPGVSVAPQRVGRLYSRLERTFDARVTSFERKRFASLFREASKAANLNSYLALMGGCYRVEAGSAGETLQPATIGDADLVVPDTEYVLTLDADSILLPDYAIRMIHFMEQPLNADVAVVQTPYSAYRGAPSRIEYIAGATTDLQYIAQQGLTTHDATFWVGANAVIRKRALVELGDEAIDAPTEESGLVLRRYIRDRTVIEDTESSIDLRAFGWRLHNYPERLSYSSTPPDLGALVIQRRRWANGGLLILPKLMRQFLRRPGRTPGPALPELLLRANYLGSISWASGGVLLLLVFPFDVELLTPFAILTAAPYFAMMASDLRHVGYRRRDIATVYALNLLLVPVNLAGTAQSIAQAITGRKPVFARTPKVSHRTVTPLLFIVVPILLMGWSGRTLLQDIDEGAVVHGFFAGANLVALGYACLALVGLRTLAADSVIGLRALAARVLPSGPARRPPPVGRLGSTTGSAPRTAPLPGTIGRCGRARSNDRWTRAARS